MSRRLSYTEKGKAPAFSVAPPRTAHVKVPLFDNTDLIRKHSLTLIGRVTNAKVQRMWSLISFLADHWKVEIRPVGANLGQGLFQFQFTSEEDLQKVLYNRPYHFAHWMIILQRWEPTTSRSFSSQIPFWIQVQGILVHLWSIATLNSIVEDIGHLDTVEITATTARMRVHIDGLQPLITASTVEFDGGEEVVAKLVYEKLEKHCTNCLCLDHDNKDYPTLQVKSPMPTLSKSHDSERTQRLQRREPGDSRGSMRSRALPPCGPC